MTAHLGQNSYSSVSICQHDSDLPITLLTPTSVSPHRVIRILKPGMGWVGVGAIIVTACFLLYRCPPSTWTSGPEPSRPDSKPVDHNRLASLKNGNDSEKTRSESRQKVVEEDTDGEASQETPKARATVPPPMDIPSFSLDSEHGSTKPEGPKRPESRKPAEQLMPPPSVKPPPSTVTAPAPSASSSSLMAPPPPRLRTTPQQPQQSARSKNDGLLSVPRVKSSAPLRPPPSAASSLRAPPSSRLSSSTLAPTSPAANARNSRKVILEPGHSPLDWAALTSNPNSNLRGANLPPTLIRVTPSMLKVMNGRKGTDAWTSYQGKVYNITPYLPFHPGGKGELLRGAGKDSGKLFAEVHPWVNWDGLLGECLVGILVSEHDAQAQENTLDAMD
ncbi:heme/steroid binding protein, putative [Paecilomyces variotii No. 5]|uniref:Heme/steroid binding protein, putative n=1 Tax=Byssochlamys spectabilis (strain No. 5 / NBRC 109023) TaxID=1356009 RepID=V5FV52_BYSSN|nr:heme/steroid binding protein, putative [Paecilomyces variotii No. 5]